MTWEMNISGDWMCDFRPYAAYLKLKQHQYKLHHATFYHVRQTPPKKKIIIIIRPPRNFLSYSKSYCQLRARRALSLYNNVPLSTRRVLSLCKVCGNKTLLALNRTSRNSINALVVLSWRYLKVYVTIIWALTLSLIMYMYVTLATDI